MGIQDYAHYNEEARTMWWAEEGQFEGREEYDPYDPDDYLPYDDDEDDEDAEALREPRPRYNAFGQRLRDDAPELPGDTYAEDAHLEAAYEDRFEIQGDY